MYTCRFKNAFPPPPPQGFHELAEPIYLQLSTLVSSGYTTRHARVSRFSHAELGGSAGKISHYMAILNAMVFIFSNGWRWAAFI